MVKIRELSDKELEKQLKKHQKILKALKKELAKRFEDDSDIEISLPSAESTSTKRVKKTGTITNLKLKQEIADKTNSSIFKLTLDDDELDSMAEKAEKVKAAPKQVTLSKLIELTQGHVTKVKDLKKQA